MLEESKYCGDVIKKFNKEFAMSKKDDEDFENSTKCWICDNDMSMVILKWEIIFISLENIEALHIEIVISRLN